MHKKILILTDSIGNPQPFLGNDSTELEETFPFIIKKNLKDTLFHQITLGHAMSSNLLAQARAYISTWKPEYVLVCSGINDATPVPFSETEKKFLFKYLLINKMGDKFRNYIKKNVQYNDKILWIRSKSRENPENFLLNLNKFINSFKSSKIFWYEIFVDDKEDKNKKNILNHINKFNKVLDESNSINFIKVKKSLVEGYGIAKDNIHLNISGHKILARKFLDQINL